MDKNLIEQYKAEMIRMYNIKPKKAANREIDAVTAVPKMEFDETGGLIGLITTVKSLYPVVNAKVTVFRGDINNMNVLEVGFADESGKTEEFLLSAPKKSMSLDSQNKIPPYSLYNMMVEADGYLTNIHLNIPIFSGVTSLQKSNMTLLETAGVDKGPQIFDELQKYNL